ncbi:hypothetical protein PtA15_1A738 [Puccinia triticina]|uniref:Uncharacterized protein n=1 Tax=Puccinia triticina TaxID=208348 RepID=A0ABY7CAA1_9BASI|nr:uncharacterized protein PtA15_1A738 [Puccinia triticina]WAQ81397.1 hypothetical protein PtA15_1A738 [Puccinia triticina]
MSNWADTSLNSVHASSNAAKTAQDPDTANVMIAAKDMIAATAAAQSCKKMVFGLPTVVKSPPAANQAAANQATETIKPPTATKDMIAASSAAQASKNMFFGLLAAGEAPPDAIPATTNVVKAPNPIKDFIDPFLLQLSESKEEMNISPNNQHTEKEEDVNGELEKEDDDDEFDDELVREDKVITKFLNLLESQPGDEQHKEIPIPDHISAENLPAEIESEDNQDSESSDSKGQESHEGIPPPPGGIYADPDSLKRSVKGFARRKGYAITLILFIILFICDRSLVISSFLSVIGYSCSLLVHAQI